MTYPLAPAPGTPAARRGQSAVFTAEELPRYPLRLVNGSRRSSQFARRDADLEPPEPPWEIEPQTYALRDRSRPVRVVNMGSDLMVYELAVQVVASDLAILRMTSPGTCGPVDTPTE